MVTLSVASVQVFIALYYTVNCDTRKSFEKNTGDLKK